MRVHKYMAKAGVASRRKSEEMVKEGLVKINGETAGLGSMVSEGDVVTVSGHVVTLEETMVYLMLNKPLECVTTAEDQFGRKTVMDYIDVPERVYPIGRLDYNTTGLLLLTNDGDLANKIMHPKHQMKKTYIAKIKGTPSEDLIRKFETGLLIEDKMTAPANLKVIKPGLVEVKIHEGRNRQVRKMLEAIGFPVITLKRSKIGRLTLGDLKAGQFRHLTEDEVNYLKEA
ncbi:rRNA pseudouridine synthase [Acidaminobacter sp. JC074]|uniref:pseudouridine synthase n=1 Tax=Acidaminobacter sp. JC074 TaxID=2530199 RepID=UPI001F111849|nr:pseudouridine synthase [Acidaminobacter sp. JC074]MCH4888839.1 rRNA pseudouridine synthase [Acidaminobacter sp. JC074]